MAFISAHMLWVRPYIYGTNESGANNSWLQTSLKCIDCVWARRHDKHQIRKTQTERVQTQTPIHFCWNINQQTFRTFCAARKQRTKLQSVIDYTRSLPCGGCISNSRKNSDESVRLLSSSGVGPATQNDHYHLSGGARQTQRVRLRESTSSRKKVGGVELKLSWQSIKTLLRI
jgi:hypothetical protein